jgi:YD repeat-containing protein
MGPNNEVLDDGTYTYTYDAAGKELTKTADVGGDYWTFGYDNANHIISAVEKTSGGTTENAVTYEYDVFGNLTEEDVNGTVTQYAVDGWNPAKVGSMGNSAFDTWAMMNGSGVLISPVEHMVHIATQSDSTRPSHVETVTAIRSPVKRKRFLTPLIGMDAAPFIWHGCRFFFDHAVLLSRNNEADMVSAVSYLNGFHA